MDAKLKLSRAKVKCIAEYPFFGSLLLKMPVVEDKDCGTMYTDGRKIGYSPEFVDSMSEPETLGVLIHEIYHVIFLHHLRRGERNPQKWNIAADYVINNNLREMGLQLPEGGLWDTQYNDMSAEMVYDMLPENLVECPWGGVVDLRDENGKPLTGEALEEAKAEINQAVAAAADMAKQQGKLPAGIDRLLDEIRKPKINWKDYLMGHFKSMHPDDYTWARPNRKFIQSGVYMPTVYGTTMGELVVAIDTSGSLSDEELGQFLGEINAICNEVAPELITVIYCDSEIANVETFEHGEVIEALNAKGGGGTRVSPVFDYIEETGIRPETLLYFTDMFWCDCPTEDPGYPVIWCSTTEDDRHWGDTHFGTTIYVDID